MVEDARFEDGAAGPLRLQAEDVDDLRVLSALVQDSVFPSEEMSWQAGRRRFTLLLNRFRWEDVKSSTGDARAERVRSLLVFGGVLKVASSGLDRAEKDMVLSLLALDFEPGEDGAGRVVLTLAGDGAIALNVECLDVSLQDVTRPYLAPSGQVPSHQGED